MSVRSLDTHMFAMSDIVVVEVACEAPVPAVFHGRRVG